jgi:hypothetical protein
VTKHNIVREEVTAVLKRVICEQNWREREAGTGLCRILSPVVP